MIYNYNYYVSVSFILTEGKKYQLWAERVMFKLHSCVCPFISSEVIFWERKSL